jgi:hypothetical protein
MDYFGNPQSSFSLNMVSIHIYHASNMPNHQGMILLGGWMDGCGKNDSQALPTFSMLNSL